jgi:hypothetical protein
LSVTKHEVYMPPRCTCGERPIVEHDKSAEAMIRRVIPSRVRCPACGRRTAWERTRFHAEIAWEEGRIIDGGTEA